MPEIDPAHAVSLIDQRAFFEKALQYGVQHGLITQAKLGAIAQEAPKGMVQIARYFGSEFLRPELERALVRMVNLVSLHLQHASQGDLHTAATLLRDHSFLSRSKAGADLLKALIVMPQNSHFGMNERGGFTDRHMAQLARWSLATYAQVQSELADRQRVVQRVEAALWLAGELGLSADELQSFEPDAEAVIRTSLLVLATHGQELPDWIGFEKMIVAMRQKGSTVVGAALQLPKGLPDDYRDAVEAVRQSVLADLPKLTQTRISVRKLFDQTPAFMGRYFWIEDALSDVGQYDRARSVAWNKFTRDHDDDGTLLTLLLCVATGVAAKPLLTQKAATGLIRKIRRTGWQPELASNYIKEHAPAQHQDDYARLWHDFVDEAQATLLSEHDGRLTDALALLRRDCNVS